MPEPQSAFEFLTDAEIIRVLERRGYVVRHKREARHPLSWNRTVPLPPGVEFKSEALAKLREQITPEMIQFTSDPGTEFMPEVHRAFLRVL